MSKINNSWEENGTAVPSSGANDVTRIPYGAEVRHGVMVSNCDIRIDGPFYGIIITKAKVIIGEKAIVKGDIFCDNIDIYGAMEGNISVGEVLTFMSTCDFKGTIKVQRFSVENGAKFDGNCQIITKDEFSKISTDALESVNKEYPTISLDKKESKGDKVKVDFSSKNQEAI